MMQITSENIGDIICLYQTGKRIRITDVDNRFVKYETESGDHYATDERSADAFIDKDPVRTAVFNANNHLGKALNAAEFNALRIILNGPGAGLSKEEIAEADQVLSSVRKQQDFLNKRVSELRFHEPAGKAMSSAFMSQLYEMGTGSHDTFMGHKVVNESQMAGRFTIDGKPFDYSSAVKFLGSLCFKREETKQRLDALIANAASRVHEGGPVLTTPDHSR